MAEKPLLRLRKNCSCFCPRRDGSALRTSAIPGGRPNFRHPWRSQALRSALFNVVMIGSVVLYVPFILLTFPLPPGEGFGE